MPATTNLLVKGKTYFFEILYGVSVNTISKLKFQDIGVSGMKVDSQAFRKMAKEIHGLAPVIKEYLSDLKYIHGENLTYVLYAEDQALLGMTRGLLALLRPSLISVWIDFTVEVDEFETAHEDDRGHRMGVFSEWDKIYSIARGMKKGDFFILSKNDIQVSNRLAKIFPTALKSQTFIQLMGLYYRAYEEKLYYFKFLLLFMIIESLIDGDDKTGVVYKIRRMCATLVGYNIEDCKDIFAKVGECYNLRSKLVHRANFNIERSYVLYIHSLVCELLIFLAISALDKKEIFNTSTQLGFGQRNTVIKNKAFKKYSTLLVNEINFIGPLKTPKSKSAETSETRKTKK